MIRSSRGDTYKDIPSELSKVGTLEDALNLVRRFYPKAYMKGSADFQSSFWVNDQLVAHAWTTNSITGIFYRVRIFENLLTPVNCHAITETENPNGANCDKKCRISSQRNS